MSYLEQFKLWLENVTDLELMDELQNLTEEQKKEVFYNNLEFGTGGLRGVLGVGTNRMNIYTVMKATQGYANYLKTKENASVAIAYDSRIKSDLFSKKAAEVFAGNGIKVYIYKELMPTPMLSFVVRELNLDGGIVITASHNPAKYNGYKVYGADGCQITQEAAEKIYNEIEKIDIFNDIKSVDFEKALENNQICYIDEEIIDRYCDYVLSNQLHQNIEGKELKIVYTPLNGTGRRSVLNILNKAGYTNITVPKEQEMPDGNFPTCKKPNPEEKEALSLAIDLARKIDADVVLATDPDCDRVGIAVKHDNDYRLINGQEMGVLLLNYICSKISLPNNAIAIKTIVTTDMAEHITKAHNIEIINVLTGFKYIGEQIGLLESKNEINRYIFGFEESYGYLTHTKARDKDAIDASLTICEMISYYKKQNKNLLDVLEELSQKYGYFVQKLKSFEFTGIDASQKMGNLMETLRKNPLKNWNNNKLVVIEDYEESKRHVINGEAQDILLPKSNVVKLIFENDITVTVRPSGTEPKLKIYYSVKGSSFEDAKNMIEKLVNDFEKIIF